MTARRGRRPRRAPTATAAPRSFRHATTATSRRCAYCSTTKIDVDHVNDLGWTALLEAVILGDGGRAHTEIVRMLLAAKAIPNIADRQGVTPLAARAAAGLRRNRAAIQAAGGR